MNYRKRESLSKRLGVSLNESPDIKSPEALLILNRQLLKQDETIYDYEKWLAFRDKYFEEILDRDGVIHCAYCGKYLKIETNDKSIQATIDHVIPVSKNGAMFDKSNMVSACYKCNQSKSDKIL
jgi:5-methylcytosine-specific restriction endonuclease McrA